MIPTPIISVLAVVFICVWQVIYKRKVRMAQQSDTSPVARVTGRPQRSQTNLADSFPTTRPTSTSVASQLPEGTEVMPVTRHGNVLTNSEQDSDTPYDYTFPYQHHAISQKIKQEHGGEKVLYEDVDDVQNNARHDEDQSHLRKQFLCDPTANPAYGIPNSVA